METRELSPALTAGEQAFNSRPSSGVRHWPSGPAGLEESAKRTDSVTHAGMGTMPFIMASSATMLAPEVYMTTGSFLQTRLLASSIVAPMSTEIALPAGLVVLPVVLFRK